MSVVRLEVDGGIGTIRLDRPPMNALDATVAGQLRTAALEATRDPGVRAVVLYGGEKVFAAGADIKQMASMDFAEVTAWVRDLSSTFELVARIPKPVVAAVTGFALGGGLELALCADVRVLADNAKVGVPEITLGVIPGAGGTQRLPRLIGPSRAKDLVFSGRQVRAAEAERIGIADVVVPAAEVLLRAREIAGRYVAGPAQALAAAKQAIDDGAELALSEALRLEAALFAGLWATEDRRVGLTSFVSDGPGKAVFTGR
ncbi:enoyl-CoA hydratase-related protein [Frankia sp. AgPm24]|uniref:Enoyl-CoA hydratase-related protein n=1 Tax=Frankia umida TaxID=573489 RepID=A0ABT0K4Q0_9ACTN|nr:MULTISPECIES: enoyl-CoA hydratase-related protein [Frankia]MCK9878775.1 enoyl-CoA hydratase-related protein [Frankia umida]MCK9924108.1 enoyl-CoA hydratase-related protein [Frankia sp. AgPm24]